MIDFDSMQTRIDHLFLLLNSKGNEAYHSEPVSQLEHALQSAYYAKYHTDKPNIILAALLHDIGHLIENETEDLLAVLMRLYPAPGMLTHISRGMDNMPAVLVTGSTVRTMIVSVQPT